MSSPFNDNIVNFSTNQHTVEVVHGAVDDALCAEGDVQLEDNLLVAGLATAAASPAAAV